MSSSNESKLLAVVARIPRGKVATYGQIARLAGLPNNARQAGAVLRRLPEESTIPWFRVVNSSGRISVRGDGTFEGLQRHELQHEGVQFDLKDRIDLSIYQWQPRQERTPRDS